MYTNEERNIIKNNIKMIENYCKNEIAPLIDYYVYVDFSETQYRKSDNSPYRQHFSFYVDKKGVVKFTMGIQTYVFDENYERTESSVSAYDSLSVEPLLLRWQTVKTKLLNEIRKQQQTKSAILNFQI